ncbi:MAG: hypothetical protein ACJ73U_35240, partial [Actinophytocola sp.]
RMLFVLRRFARVTPDNPRRAMVTMLAHPDVFAPDRIALRAFVRSGHAEVAVVAGMMLSYFAEQDGDLLAAIDCCAPMLAAWGTSATPWLWIVSLSRIGELTLRAERSEEALASFTEAVRLLGAIGAPRDMVGVYWGMMIANLQLGRLDEAAHWLGRATADNSGNPDADADDAAFQFLFAARAELSLARGEVDEGLRLWRRAVLAAPAEDTTDGATGTATGDDVPPWVLETWVGAVGAHARFGRAELVADLMAELARRLERMLANPIERPPVYVIEQQLAGAALVALGAADVALGAVGSGVRLVALAEQFKVLRGFRPTLTVEDVRAAVQEADGPAYADALSEYAGLDRDHLRHAALTALRARRIRPAG